MTKRRTAYELMRSIIFYSIVACMITGNVVWWRHALKSAARMRRPRAWRRAVNAWSFTMSAGMLMIILSRAISGHILHWVPQPIVAAVYIWHVMFALPWLAWHVLVVSVRRVARQISRRISASPSVDSASAAPPAVANEPIPFNSRRQFLAAAALATPPALATLGAWRAYSQFDQFRINTVTLRIPNLPPALDGLRIAHVSDIHVGRFTDDALLNAVVEKTNAMRPDLVLYTGDLIDFDLADLPAGISVLKRCDPKFGLAACEGNHDLMMGRHAFEHEVRKSGLAMPINGSHVVTVRGQEIQLLALRWGGPNLADAGGAGGAGDADIAASVRTLFPQIRSGAFPILLAHHPHAFDYLGDADIPLVLAGHTHGGQINVGPIHPASLRFRYLSGLYRRPDGKQMFVSNGVGNWFPLRINAPAEIGNITLRAM